MRAYQGSCNFPIVAVMLRASFEAPLVTKAYKKGKLFSPKLLCNVLKVSLAAAAAESGIYYFH